MGQFRSTIRTERIDEIIMEGESPTINPNDFRMMIATDLNRPLEQVWRVRLYEDGTVALYSFAMPHIEKNFGKQDRLNNASYLPDWVKERIAVLQICESGAIVEGTGQKVSERVYYVIE
jgi:hypothetical protein